MIYTNIKETKKRKTANATAIKNVRAAKPNTVIKEWTTTYGKVKKWWCQGTSKEWRSLENVDAKALSLSYFLTL